LHGQGGQKKPGSKPGVRIPLDEELALTRLLLTTLLAALSRLLALLARLLLSAATLLATLARVLLTTLLTGLLLSAAALLAALAALVLLAWFLFTRIHENSFIGPHLQRSRDR
jgi:hypothetical protein